MSDRDQKIEALNTLLNSSLAGVSPATDLASVLGMLEATRATGIFRAREGSSMQVVFYMRFAEGRIVKVMGGSAGDMVARMLSSKELFWSFKAVENRPHGDIDECVTSLLLDATTRLDHAERDAVDDVPSLTAGLKPGRSRIGAQLRVARRSG